MPLKEEGTNIMPETNGEYSVDGIVNDKNAMQQKPRLQEATMWSDERGNLKFVNIIVRRPMTIFFVILITCLFLSFILFYSLVKSGENPFGDTANQFDLKDIRSIQYDSLRLASLEVKADRRAVAVGDAASATKVQSEIGDVTYWTFQSEQPETGLYGTRSSIEAMKSALDLFIQAERYPDFCQLDYRQAKVSNSDPECIKPLTALNMYYSSDTWDSNAIQGYITEMKEYPDRMELLSGQVLCLRNTGTNVTCELEATAEELEWSKNLAIGMGSTINQWDGKSDLVENITEATEFSAYLLKVPALKGVIDFGFDSEFSPDNLVSIYSRAIVFWGAPLNLTTSDNSMEDASSKSLTVEELEEEAKEKKKNDDKALKDYILKDFLKEMDRLATDETNPEVNSYYFMIALILDVLLKIVVRDALLALISVSFVFFWLRINVGSWFLAGIGILEIFLSCPLAWFLFTIVCQVKYFAFLNVLSIFIVCAIGADDIFIFMDAYKQSRTRDANILVDLETRMSWVFRRTGTAMAITSATTCTAFLCTLITPIVNIRAFGIFAAFVILLDYILVMTLFCTAVVIYHNKFENQGCFKSCCCTKNGNPTEDARQALLQSGEAGVKGDRVTEFFKNKVAGFVNKSSSNRLILLTIFAAWTGFSIYNVTKLEPTKETEQLLDEDHPLQKSFSILGNQFPTADDDQGLEVHYVWGLEEIDRTGVNLLLDPKNYGKPQYVETFDYNKQCQTELLAVCEDLKTNTDYSELIKREDGVGSIKCFIEELGAFYVYETGGYNGEEVEYCAWVKSGSWKTEAWQVPPSEIATIVPKFLGEQSCIDESQSISALYSNEFGWDGKNVKYAAITAESNLLDPFSIKPESTTRGEYDQFAMIQNTLTDSNSAVSTACTGQVIMTDLSEIFIFMNNQTIYVRSAILSSFLGIGIAFGVLLLATCSFHIALFASVNIACVLVSVVGTMVLLGWSLGINESVLIGIIAGFSVDYVVHLAHAYKSAPPGDTDSRIRAAFGDMGISVLNGMITSVAASIPLFFCQLQFFSKFGTFLCMVIVFSWLFANFAFMSVLAQLKIPIRERKNKDDDDSIDDDVLGATIDGGKAIPGVKVAEEDGWSYERNPTLQDPVNVTHSMYETPTTTTMITKPSAPTNTQNMMGYNYDENDESGEISA